MKVFLERLWQDLYHGSRMLAKNPAFTIVAVISLAIGIGANCAMYSWADALLLRPLPVARPGDVISVGTKVSLAGFTSLVNSYPDFRDLRDRTRSFDNLTAFTSLTVGLTDEAGCSGTNEIWHAGDQQPVCRDGRGAGTGALLPCR